MIKVESKVVVYLNITVDVELEVKDGTDPSDFSDKCKDLAEAQCHKLKLPNEFSNLYINEAEISKISVSSLNRTQDDADDDRRHEAKLERGHE